MIEMILHMLWGAWIVVVPYLFFILEVPRGVAAFLIPIAIILPREIVDQWPINHWRDTVIDLLMFGLGGWVLYKIFLSCFW